jgi:hypothetical protein
MSKLISASKAIAIASGRVSIIPQGRDYILQTWNPQHRAWWESHSMTYHQAIASAWEAKIRTALKLLDNISDPDQFVYDYSGPREDWRKVVRRLARDRD